MLCYASNLRPNTYTIQLREPRKQTVGNHTATSYMKPNQLTCPNLHAGFLRAAHCCPMSSALSNHTTVWQPVSRQGNAGLPATAHHNISGFDIRTSRRLSLYPEWRIHVHVHRVVRDPLAISIRQLSHFLCPTIGTDHQLHPMQPHIVNMCIHGVAAVRCWVHSHLEQFCAWWCTQHCNKERNKTGAFHNDTGSTRPEASWDVPLCRQKVF